MGTSDHLAAANDPPAPCQGLRVLDFTTVVSGPICTQMLGDLGADVVKVETLDGDISRRTTGPYHQGLSGFFSQFNRNKRSLAVDLKAAGGREVVSKLAARCDVAVENFRPGVSDRLGVGAADLQAMNPELIHVSITGFGPDGPYAPLPAYDHVVQGLSGMMPAQGAGAGPQMFRSVVVDKAAGLTAVSSILAALLARERGLAKGQRIEVPMLDAYAAFMLPEQLGPHTFLEVGKGGPDFDPFRIYPTADGHVVGLAVQDHQFRAICEALECADLADDPRFSSLGERFAHMDELADRLMDEFRKWPTAEVVARARERGAPFAPVNDLASFMDDPQVVHNGIIHELHDEKVGGLRLLRPPARMEATPLRITRRPPQLGEHTDDILALAGFDSAQVDALRADGVVG
jgi:crotonobetainyl-CoA:carnitine CoA-transferase CaiB-like acyl-CoA transferase